MDELIALVKAVSKNKVKQISVIGNFNGKSSIAVEELYNGILENRFQTEEEILQYFYSNNTNGRKYLSKLKSNLRSRLINTIFFIDINKSTFSDNQRAYYTCYKNSAAVKILIGRYARKPAIPLAEKTLKDAILYEFTDIALAMAKELRMHYGNIIGDHKKFVKYNKLVEKYSAIFLAELKAEEYYNSLAVHTANSRASKLEILEIAKSYFFELENIRKELESFRLSFISFFVFLYRYQIENDYLNTLVVCEEALQYFRTKEHLTSVFIKCNFLNRKLVCNLRLGNLTDAKSIVTECLEIIPEGTMNWFNTLNYAMIVNFHLNDFQEAYNVFTKATSDPNFSDQYQNTSENWLIFEGFIHYFFRTKRITINKDKLKRFRITKFLNEVPTYSKDKRGANVSILILHILFLLLDHKYGKIIDRMESLRTYTHRYLRKDDTFRSNCFIKMLLQLPLASFHKEGVERRAKKYKEKLISVPIQEANQSAEIEIVPYEMLWEFVLDSLDNKFHHTNKKM